MTPPLSKSHARQRRHRRVRFNVRGTAQRPRLVVFRSLRHIQAQLIDDRAAHTLVVVTDESLPNIKGPKTARATMVGQQLAKLATAKKIATVVFDRGGYRFHGRVKALADAARQGGLKF